MKINEIFYSIQGEGMSVGKPRLFIRFSGCSLKCKFCDTKYHIKNHELNKKDETLLKKYKDWCITGGEPMLFQSDICKLINKYKPNSVEIETNGTIPFYNTSLIDRVNYFNISPKEARFQKDATTFLVKPKLLEYFQYNFIVKFVYSDKSSRFFIQKIIKNYAIPKCCVWIMPEGKDKKTLEKHTKEVWEYCLKNNYNFSPRLQVIVWDKKKGI